MGVVIYELIYGIPPFYSTNVNKMYQKTVTKRIKFKKYVKISDDLKDFLFNLLHKDPKKRLGSISDSEELMKHKWFKNFDWKKLSNF